MTLRRAIGGGLIGCSLVIFLVGALSAAFQPPSPAPPSDAAPWWLTGGLAVTLAGCLVTYGEHREFKTRTTERLNKIDDSLDGCVKDKGLTDAIDGVHRRFDDMQRMQEILLKATPQDRRRAKEADDSGERPT